MEDTVFVCNLSTLFCPSLFFVAQASEAKSKAAHTLDNAQDAVQEGMKDAEDYLEGKSEQASEMVSPRWRREGGKGGRRVVGGREYPVYASFCLKISALINRGAYNIA